MMDDLARIERRFLEIESLLNTQEVAADPSRFRELSRERSDLEEAVGLFREYKRVMAELVGASELAGGDDPDMADLAQAEVASLSGIRTDLEDRLRVCLLPRDPNDGRNVILEIRQAAGGDEAGLFASELFRMYLRYSERRRWTVEILQQQESEIGGLKEGVALIVGEKAYGRLKHESGVHRVQRVPATETQGRVHTSTVTVAVLPEAEEVDDITIADGDLRIDTYRAGGAGGQHVNRTDSAVRITHIPTGIVVACQDERSQIKNRSKAMKILQAKLLEIAQQEAQSAVSSERSAQVGRGDRSERIRTYNFPQSRVTDHRAGLTTHAIHDVMDGDIEALLDGVAAHFQEEALKLQSRSGE
jgi:peptide chain release factor 1